jgi:hypothetical protein
MIPMWVINHDEVRGNATRIAVYVGLRTIAWEHPDRDWNSTREMGRAVSDVIGLGDEACRKHLTELKKIRAIIKTESEIVIPEDPPETAVLGMALGTPVPKVGSGETQTEGSHLLPLKEEEEPPVGTTGSGGKADLNKEHPRFVEFWEMYPRKMDRQEAVRRFNAVLRDKVVTVDEIMEGLRREVTGWKRTQRPVSKTKHPATWLRNHGWLNPADVPDGGGVTAASKRAAADTAQRTEIELAIEAGRHADAWAMLIEKASAIEAASWWKQADESLGRGLLVSGVAASVGRTMEEVQELASMRERALKGLWSERDLSPDVRHLTS